MSDSCNTCASQQDSCGGSCSSLVVYGSLCQTDELYQRYASGAYIRAASAFNAAHYIVFFAGAVILALCVLSKVEGH